MSYIDKKKGVSEKTHPLVCLFGISCFVCLSFGFRYY